MTTETPDVLKTTRDEMARELAFKLLQGNGPNKKAVLTSRFLHSNDEEVARKLRSPRILASPSTIIVFPN